MAIGFSLRMDAAEGAPQGGERAGVDNTLILPPDGLPEPPAMSMIERFEKMLASGTDGALLRFGLGGEYLKAGDPERAAMHLREAVSRDPGYSAAWKLLGKALEVLDRDAAAEAYRQGMAAAEVHGDKQAAREMAVFLRRLDKLRGAPSEGESR
jgi:tetratricopeptide (TPR) repeat protein